MSGGPTTAFQSIDPAAIPAGDTYALLTGCVVPRPIAFVSAGGGRSDEPAWGMRIFRPDHEREFVGHADYHGAWLDWELA